MPALLLFLIVNLPIIQPEPLQAQLAGNGEVIIDITSELLLSSDSWPQNGSPVLLEADIPSPLKSRLVGNMLGSGHQVRIDGESDRYLRLEWTTSNSLKRIDRQTALRTLAGNLTIYQLSEDRDVLGTEVIPFSYEDTVDADSADELAGSWTAGRFRVTDMDRRPGIWRRIAEPVIIIAATGVSVFLLYNVRSR